MNFLELVKARYSARKYANRPVEAEKLDYIMECVRFARGLLQKNILPDYTDIRRAAFHINRHIRGLYPEIPHAVFLVFKNQLSAALMNGRTAIADCLKNIIRLFA